MPKETIKKVKKLELREERWLIGESTYLKQLKKDIENKDKRAAQGIAKRMGRYEYRLEIYHKRVLKALAVLKAEGLPEGAAKELNEIEKDINVYRADLVKEISRFGGELRKHIKEGNWDELAGIVGRLRQDIQAWIALDKRLIRLSVYKSVDTEKILRYNKRLFDYAQLLAKGASEAERMFSENYNKKLELIEGMKEAISVTPKLPDLQKIVAEDIKLYQRIIRWADSKDSKTAVRILGRALILARELEIDKEVASIINLNKRDRHILERIGINLDKQATNANFFKMMPPGLEGGYGGFINLLNQQKKLFEALRDCGKKSSEALFTIVSQIKRLVPVSAVTGILGKSLATGISLLPAPETSYKVAGMVYIFIALFLVGEGYLVASIEDPNFELKIRKYLTTFKLV